MTPPIPMCDATTIVQGIVAVAGAYSASESSRAARKAPPAAPSNPAPAADPMVNPEDSNANNLLTPQGTRRSLRVDLVTPGNKLSRVSGAPVNTGLQVRTPDNLSGGVRG